MRIIGTKKVKFLIIPILLIILTIVGIYSYKIIGDFTNINSECNEKSYIDLINKSNIDIFLYDVSSQLNNIQEETKISNDLMEKLKISNNFYKQLLSDFSKINIPEQFIKDNNLIINYLEKCIYYLDLILINKDTGKIQKSSIKFIENNYELIKVLENIRITYERNNY